MKFIKCDVSNKEQLLGAFDKVNTELGYIDIVINNAGILNDSMQTYEKQIAINVVSNIYVSILFIKFSITNDI